MFPFAGLSAWVVLPSLRPEPVPGVRDVEPVCRSLAEDSAPPLQRRHGGQTQPEMVLSRPVV